MKNALEMSIYLSEAAEHIRVRARGPEAYLDKQELPRHEIRWKAKGPVLLETRAGLQLPVALQFHRIGRTFPKSNWEDRCRPH